MRIRLLVLTAVLLAAGSAPLARAGVSYPLPTPETLERAGKLFKENCAVCHGDSLKGDGQAAAALDPLPANLTIRATYKHGSDKDSMHRTIAEGAPGTAMIAWKAYLSDADIRLLCTYIESRSK